MEPPPTPSGLDDFRARLSKAGVRSEELVVDATGTVFGAQPEDTVDELVDALPVLSGDGTQRDLRLKASIGRGGMGEVFGAQQIALARDVAVKRSHRGATDRHERSAALVREGRATGALEHPNIVPVYALGKSPEGDVLLVMKRIEGTTWSERLRKRASFAEGLSRELAILMDVCRAVHFAHRRGVLHRDLKPDNVMIGSFGEVYVLDWGLAVSIGETTIPGVPHARDLSTISGTPSYMAPEMVLPGGVLDARTDVYLLGGILHAVLTGRAPHQGKKLDEILHDAWSSSPPTFGEDVPGELAAICVRALARDPAARFPSAEELRAAVEEFLAHASARVLCAEAGAQLLQLERLVAEGREEDTAAQRAFSAARFGFEAAQREWPSSPEAAAGLQQALQAMARYEIGRGHLDAALVIIGEIQTPPLDLTTALETLKQSLGRRERERSRAERIAQNVDIRSNSERRGAVLLGFGIVWGGLGIVGGLLARAGLMTPSYLEMVLAHVGVLIAAVGFRWWLLKSGNESRAGRALIALAIVDVVSSTLMWLGVWRMAGPMELGVAMSQVITGVICWAFASILDRRLLVTAGIILGGVPVVLLLPEYASELNGACIAAGLGYGGWVWRRPGQARELSG